jgi:hypothetical protein
MANRLTRDTVAEEARRAVSKGGQPTLLLPILRDAVLRTAPQHEAV